MSSLFAGHLHPQEPDTSARPRKPHRGLRNLLVQRLDFALHFNGLSALFREAEEVIFSFSPVLERVSAALESGDSVKISGFGTFSVRQKGRRIGRNPKTGVEVPILPRRVLTFRPSQVLKAHVNGTAVPTGDDAADDGAEA